MYATPKNKYDSINLRTSNNNYGFVVLQNRSLANHFEPNFNLFNYFFTFHFRIQKYLQSKSMEFIEYVEWFTFEKTKKKESQCFDLMLSYDQIFTKKMIFL